MRLIYVSYASRQSCRALHWLSEAAYLRPPLRKFELTGQISFRQLLLLWQTLDSLDRLYQLTQLSKERAAIPMSIDEVLKDEF